MDQEKIGKFIAENRRKKNITQLELAEKLGVTDRSVSNWENGKNMPDLSLFKPLCNILDISINELMSGEAINDNEYNDKLEENIINTIDYIDKKNFKNNDIRSICFLVIGMVGIYLAEFIFIDYEVKSYLTVICMILCVYAIRALFIKYKLARKIIAILLLAFCIVSLFLN